jgi:LuxR family transcriptional regulator, maltose regulon positive regulatory protein
MVRRPRLIARLNEGLQSGRTLGVTLISAPAGFGKTTLISEWVAGCERAVAWLSLDEADNDPNRFLAYLVAALQTVAPTVGAGALGVLQSPQSPPTESILTTLLNEITSLPDPFVLVLDDCHVIDARPADALTSVDEALTFLIEHLPPQMHLVLATREDPDLPIARLRAQGQLTELRAADLRFTPAEAAEFLNQVMGLSLSAEDIAALETRTEGWIAGLQLAAISMQGHPDAARFVKSFTGSHHFVMDYLVAEVLHQQPESVQTFLLRTSILDRLCGPLCEAVLRAAPASGQATLEYLERANLFIIPLDHERRWYRYHHLFADLLRQRLQRAAPSTQAEREEVADYHIRASQWYEENGLDIEAFRHAAAANDVERAERLMEGKGIPLHLRGAATAILDWLESLPTSVLNARPSLWWKHASLLLVIGQTTGVEEKLQAAEAALQVVPSAVEALDDKTRNLIGQIAAARATLALTQYRADAIIVQARRALEYLHPDNLPYRSVAHWAMGFACYLQGDRAAAGRAYTEAISLSQASGDIFTTILATSSLGNVQELENQLNTADETYRKVLTLIGDLPLPSASDAYLGLARIRYEWNDLEAAEQHGQQSLQLARQYERVIDRFLISEVFLARLRLAQGDVAGAAAILAQAAQSARQHHFVHRIPEIAAAQVLTLLHQGWPEAVAAADQLAQAHDLPLSQARVHLAKGHPPAALAVLEPLRQQMEAKGWQDERLKGMVLQAVAFHAQGENDKASQLLAQALALAEPGGFIRLFVDEGLPMADLLTRMNASGEGGALHLKGYIHKLLDAFEKQKLVHPAGAAPASGTPQDTSSPEAFTPARRAGASVLQPLVEPLSQRELEVLQLIAQRLSNREIGERLFIALDTVKGHNRRIFGKLQVQTRDDAIARARELGLL